MIQVSTIVPVYNGESTIAAAIDNVLNQNFDATEVIVVNDGSTDGTALILRGYGSKIRVVEQSNRGVSAARNAGAAIARGDYLAFLDADDEWLPGKLAKAVLALDRNAAATLAFSDFIQIGQDGSLDQPSHIGRAPSMDDLLARNWGILPSSVVMRRRVFERCGGFREEFRGPGAGEDAYMCLVAREQGEFVYIPEPLIVHHRPAVVDLLDKYEPGRRIFVELVRDRYGTASKALLKDTQQYFASLALQKALQHLDNGNWLRALLQSVRVLSYDPIFFARPQIRSRLFNRKTVALISKLLSVHRARSG